MSGSRPHRHRVPHLRAQLVLGAAAVICAALTAGQALLPVLASAHPGGHDARQGATAADRRHHGTPPDPDQNCTLIVPPAPLSAAGLATPYRFVATSPRAGACHEANAKQSAFVEAAILDPAAGTISIYHPLVIDDGTRPAIPPAVPTLPRGGVVGVWFGFQAGNLTLRDGTPGARGRAPAGCVNGTPGSVFGQFAYCGAPQFFAAANAALRAGKLHLPALGTARDGKPCPTTRDFSVVDQDQSDNLPGSYLATADGRTAQFSAANQRALRGATVLNNASDNGLVDVKLDPVLGCTPATAPDLSAGGKPSPALALNELQAAAQQAAPIALVPPNDPMAQVDGDTSITKTNLYRAGVDQAPVNRGTDTGRAYCTDLAAVAVPRLELDKRFTKAAPSPDPAAAANLHVFLVDRLNASWTNLNCPALTGKPSPSGTAGATAAPTTTVTARTGDRAVAADPGFRATAAPTAPQKATAAPTASPTTTPTTTAAATTARPAKDRAAPEADATSRAATARATARATAQAPAT